MTTDLWIDRALALAIGWREEQFSRGGFDKSVLRLVYRQHSALDLVGRAFSHKDPAVIWRIAERFDCFPFSGGRLGWAAFTPNGRYCEHANACTAVALAVIAAHGGVMTDHGETKCTT